jgi:ubiquinone/menaquinone biosynthesis C-methylase UbiE
MISRQKIPPSAGTSGDDKTKVYDYWNRNPCGTNLLQQQGKFTRAYFEAIEEQRYSREPEVMSFAQFPRFHGQKVLEVGIGVGTDFIQWIRAGAEAYGIDLTPEAIEHVTQRVRIYGLHPEEIRLADCENLPYPDGVFDLVYSWGVIHHTPNTVRALAEIVRVCRPGGLCKVMVYNRHSLAAFYMWVRKALLLGRPWRSFGWCVNHYVESFGTKAFTDREIEQMLGPMPIRGLEIHRHLTYWDTYRGRWKWLERTASLVSGIWGTDNLGWFMTIQFQKQDQEACPR